MVHDLSLMGLGALIGRISKSAPPKEVLDDLRESKPEFYDIVDIDLSTARNNELYLKSGVFMWIDNQFARGKVTLRLNEPEFKQLDLRRLKYIAGPFYRFFITNVAGQGLIRLFISRGYQAASQPIEAIDMAELAVRLGSISKFDRRGDVIFQDNFEDGINKWVRNEDGTGAPVSWSAARSHSGGFSCLLTGGSAGERLSGIYKYLPYPVSGSLGFEVSFSIDTGPDRLIWDMYIFNGSTYLQPAIKFDVGELDALSYYDSTGTWVDLSPAPRIMRTADLFHTIKIVADYENKKYVRMMLNNVVYDLSSLALYEATSVSDPRTYFGINNYSRFGYNDKVYVDDPIVTQNEP